MALLTGRRVALLETRMSEEARTLVRGLGGTPYSVAAVREVVHPERIGPFIEALAAGHFSVVVFLTGAGVSALLREADRLGRLEATLAALRLTTVACRGPKPTRVLHQHHVSVPVSAAEPFTTKQLLDALAAIDLDSKAVALVHYGEPNRTLVDALARRRARLEELLLYEWKLPDNLEPLRLLVQELIDGRIDAIAFTNEIQCRHLFLVAEEQGVSDRLTGALNADVAVAAVGPVCADALHALGVTPDVIPARPTMDSMITALAEYFELTEGLLEP